jgi:hypothetical protein
VGGASFRLRERRVLISALSQAAFADDVEITVLAVSSSSMFAWNFDVALDRRGHTLQRQLVGEVGHFEADDVGDVSSELCGVPTRSVPPRAAMLPDGVERPEIVVKPRNNVLRDEPPAFRGVVGSPAAAYSDAEQARAMLVHKLQDDSVTLFGIDERNGGVPRCWAARQESVAQRLPRPEQMDHSAAV